MELWNLHLFETLKVAIFVNILTIVIRNSNGKIIIKRPQVTEYKWIHGKVTYPDIKAAGLDYIYHTTCNYNGVTYATGEFHLSNCVTCFCNGTTGQVKCASKTCPKILNCVKYDGETLDNCCPKCVEYGCYHNSTAYRAGEKIPKNACTKCFCPWEAREKGGSQPKCLTLKCNLPRCVDSVVRQGKCCAICPNGPNCYLDDQIIKEGERIYVDKCRYCYCNSKEPILKDKPRRATCQRSFFCL